MVQCVSSSEIMITMGTYDLIVAESGLVTPTVPEIPLLGAIRDDYCLVEAVRVLNNFESRNPGLLKSQGLNIYHVEELGNHIYADIGHSHR